MAGRPPAQAAQAGDIDALDTLAGGTGGAHALTHYQDADGYTALHRAAYNGKVAAMIRLLALGASPRAKTHDGWEPLHCAARWCKAGATW